MAWGQILSPRLVDIVDYGIGGLSHRPAKMQPAGPVRHPYAIVDYIPQSGTKNLAAAVLRGGVCSLA